MGVSESRAGEAAPLRSRGRGRGSRRTRRGAGRSRGRARGAARAAAVARRPSRRRARDRRAGNRVLLGEGAAGRRGPARRLGRVATLAPRHHPGCAMVAALLYARGPRSPGEEGAAESREHPRRARGINDAPKTARQVWAARLLLGLPIPFFVLGILAGLEFIKDDAYISFRYAHNLVTGHGLVFNTGERLEGFTNFLWVLVLSPFEALGWDLFQVCEVLGTILGSIAWSRRRG